MAPLRFKRTTLLLIGLWLGGLAAWLAVGEPPAAYLQPAPDQPAPQALSGQVRAEPVILRAAKASPRLAPRPVQADEPAAGPSPGRDPNRPTPSDDDVPPSSWGIEPVLPPSNGDDPVPAQVVPDRAREALELFQTALEAEKHAIWLMDYATPPSGDFPDRSAEIRAAFEPSSQASASLAVLPQHEHRFQFTGVVTDERGKLLPGHGVFAFIYVGEQRNAGQHRALWDQAYGKVFSSVLLGWTDETGRFELSYTAKLRCPPDLTFDLHAVDSSSTCSAVVTRVPGRYHEPATLICPGTGDIELQLLTPEGAPVADVAIELGWDELDAAAGAKGAYEFSLPLSDEQGLIEATGIAAGRRVLRLLGESYKDVPPIECLVKSGETTTVRTPRVKALTGLRVSFTMEGDEWCNAVWLLLRDSSGDGRADIVLRAWPDSAGRAELVFETASAGQWDIYEQDGDDLLLLCRDVSIVAGRMLECVLRLTIERDPPALER